jgi:hypothetical protein
MLSGDLLELMGDEIQGPVPGNSFEFSLPALTDTPQGILQAFGVIGDIKAGKTPQTNTAQLRIGEFGRFHLDHPISLDMGQNPTGINAAVGGANGSDQLCVGCH